jgi:hypothetical protein
MGAQHSRSERRINENEQEWWRIFCALKHVKGPEGSGARSRYAIGSSFASGIDIEALFLETIARI